MSAYTYGAFFISSLPLKVRALTALPHPKSIADADNRPNFSRKEPKTHFFVHIKTGTRFATPLVGGGSLVSRIDRVIWRNYRGTKPSEPRPFSIKYFYRKKENFLFYSLRGLSDIARK